MQLQDLKSPADIQNLSLAELEDLAQQIRKAIIDQVSKTGGHLAPCLGAVELSIALHRVYQTPKDKIVWDVGHQAYAHKLLTGRFAAFNTLRQFGGISGFPKRTESEHDAFGVGHASTSISAALGYAVGRDHLEEDFSVVAVIGDGSMTGGMVFEALNNSGETKSLTIVLNDNKMSIAPNVGSLSRYLNRLITDPTYNRVREDWHQLMHKLPGHFGRRVEDILGRAETVAKSVLKPGRLFEDLGCRYFGPIDGHSLTDLTEILSRVKKMPGVNIVHVLTEKGRGLKIAEQDPHRWHGAVPFDPDSGDPADPPKPQPALTTVFGKAMLELAKKDPKIIGITGAMPSGCGLNILAKDLPKQVVDVGIAEGHAVTFAAGLACTGMIPVVAIYSTFLQRAYDQIIHDVALQHLKVVFALDRAGLVGADGPTHHGSFDLSYLRTVPELTILAPSNEEELRNHLYSALYTIPGPVAIRFPRGSSYQAEIPQGFTSLGNLKPAVLSPGHGVLLLGAGFMVAQMRKVHDLLAQQNISSTLVDAKVIKPLDAEAYRELFQEHHTVVTLEDNSITGGYGSAIAELILELGVPCRLLRLGLPDAFVEHGEIPQLYKTLGLDAESVTQRILKFLNPVSENT